MICEGCGRGGIVKSSVFYCQRKGGGKKRVSGVSGGIVVLGFTQAEVYLQKHGREKAIE